MIPESIPLLIQRYFAATRAMDVNAWLVCFADNAASYDSYGGPPVQGKEELRTF
jgi:steroid Delta-isomerase